MELGEKSNFLQEMLKVSFSGQFTLKKKSLFAKP